jgi:hypothetical protein
MTIIDDARENPAVEALYQAVDAVTPITATIVPGRSWASSTAGGVATIEAGEAGEAKYFDAALFHELLHADFKNQGYRQHLTLVPTSDRTERLFGLLNPLDNELQHHRIYARFVAAGFAPETFYDDDDKSAFTKTRKELRKMSPADPLDLFVLKLITVIAPGGCGTDKARQQLRTFLYNRAGPKKAAKLQAIEAHITAWASGTTTDVGPTLKAIYEAFGDCDGAWIGASMAFPDEVFFTGAAFEIAVAEAYVKGRP